MNPDSVQTSDTANAFSSNTTTQTTFTFGSGGVNNYVHFVSHANGAVGNTANVNYETFKVTSSMINFSNTTADFTYNGTSDGSTFLGYTAFSLDQNIKLAASRTLKAQTNGQFTINCTMSTSNSHVSPVIDLDRLSLIAIENDVDDAILSANDITVTTVGGGYSNTVNGAYTASVSSPDTGSNTATVNVHVEVTLNLTSNSTSLASGNSDYTTNDDNPSKFVKYPILSGILVSGFVVKVKDFRLLRFPILSGISVI